MPPLLKLFLSFLKIGAVSFGGGWTVVGLIHQEVVGSGLMTEEAFRQAVAIAQVTPGPVALNTATLAGWAVGGWGGAILGTLAVILVPVLCVTLLAILAARIGKAARGLRDGLQESLRIGALAMTALTVWSLASPEGFSPRMIAFSAVSCLAALKTRINPAFVILACGLANALLGLALRRLA